MPCLNNPKTRGKNGSPSVKSSRNSCRYFEPRDPRHTGFATYNYYYYIIHFRVLLLNIACCSSLVHTIPLLLLQLVMQVRAVETAAIILTRLEKGVEEGVEERVEAGEEDRRFVRLFR